MQALTIRSIVLLNSWLMLLDDSYYDFKCLFQVLAWELWQPYAVMMERSQIPIFCCILVEEDREFYQVDESITGSKHHQKLVAESLDF